MPQQEHYANPVAAVGAVCLRADTVLLIRRAKPPLAGAWSLPGGRIEPGERAVEAVHRELAEETGVSADLWTMPCAGAPDDHAAAAMRPTPNSCRSTVLKRLGSGQRRSASFAPPNASHEPAQPAPNAAAARAVALTRARRSLQIPSQEEIHHELFTL